MILCLDVGNTNFYGGVFDGDEIKFRFRYNTMQASTSDQLGLFLKSVLKENNITDINKISICSVVPSIDYSLRSACIKYFDVEPFILKAGVKTKLKIKTQNPKEVGADLISNAIAAVHRYPNQNVIVVDMGTATTLCSISKEQEYLGCVIMPGMRVSMEALSVNAAKLMAVAITKPESVVGRSTGPSIQSGLYYGQLAALKEISERIENEEFGGEKSVIIGTGGFSTLFSDEGVFAEIVPDLVLEGLRLALSLN